MTCDDALPLMVADFEGRLDEAQPSALREHLAVCEACRAAADAQADVAVVLASRLEEDVAPSFAARLAERLDEESGWFGLADWRALTLRLAPVAALLMLAAGVIAQRTSATSGATTETMPASLSSVVETMAVGETDRLPVTSVLWQLDASDDSVLLAVLAAPSDATMGRESGGR
jgi:predicted anti-sigma-YlaC factor YlaD